jgi:hypothetical protein
MARCSRYACLLALVCLPLLLVGMRGAAAPPHQHSDDNCGEHLHAPATPGRHAALTTRLPQDDHAHCCLCEHCHDFSLDAMWTAPRQLDRVKPTPAVSPLISSLSQSHGDARRDRRRLPVRPPSDPLARLRTVVMLT